MNEYDLNKNLDIQEKENGLFSAWLSDKFSDHDDVTEAVDLIERILSR